MGGPDELRQGDERPLPLSGVRVCDFTWIIAGPQATRILADLGAEVIKVENEAYLDAVRGAGGLHNNFNRNKLGITANLHHPGGREVVENLIRKSDIVIENFSTGAFARMGFSYDRLKELRPDIIYVSLSGFGQVGRDRDHGTWGPTAQGVSGLTAMSGLPGMPPAGWGYSYLDHTAGFYGAIAALLALYHRRQTGEGQHVDMSQVETGMFLAGVQMLDFQVNKRPYQAIGNGSVFPPRAPHGIYPCSVPDTWIAIASDSDASFDAICDVLNLAALRAHFPTLDSRLANQAELDASIAEATRAWLSQDLADALQAADVHAALCQTIEDRMEHDPQLASRRFYRSALHETLGEHRFEGLPMTFSRSRWRLDHGAPVVGQHTREVLREVLDLSEQDVNALAEEAAI